MKGQSRESKEQRKKGSAFIILVLFMCVLATVAAVILISSPTVSVQYKDIGGVVIDKQHAMIAAITAVLSGIAAFAVRHHQAFWNEETDRCNRWSVFHCHTVYIKTSGVILIWVIRKKQKNIKQINSGQKKCSCCFWQTAWSYWFLILQHYFYGLILYFPVSRKNIW